QRVAQAVDRQEGSLRQLARRFAVSLSFITRLLNLRRQTGSLDPRPHRSGPPPLLDEAGRQRLRQLVHDQPDALFNELATQLGCSGTTVWRALRKLKITRKKKTFAADERNRPAVQRKRQEFQQELATLDPKQALATCKCQHQIILHQADFVRRRLRPREERPEGHADFRLGE